jgi:hypothetical protein
MRETELDQQDREAAEFHAAWQEIEREASDALEAALIRPLTPDEVAALRFVAHMENRK